MNTQSQAKIVSWSTAGEEVCASAARISTTPGDAGALFEQARDNRRLLYNLMTSVGFVNYRCEWWHYAYGERQWAVLTGKSPFYGFCPACDD